MNFLEKLKAVRVVFLDIDGVLTDGTVMVLPTGEQLRTFYIKDGWAMNYAVKHEHLKIVVISAGQDPSVIKRLEYLGLTDIHIGVADKWSVFEEYIEKYALQPDEFIYMGDDIPDYKIMSKIELSACPADSSDDILKIATYISHKDGGKGAVRDILEKILKLQGKWPTL